MITDYFPHMLECFLLTAKDGKPPSPHDAADGLPVESTVVNSEEELQEQKQILTAKHPGGWLAQRPMDVR